MARETREFGGDVMDKSKSLQELENDDWGEPDEAPTNMIKRCLAARRVPLGEMSAEQCRLLLGQKISPLFLVPIALEFLARDPLEESEMYPGALLNSVLNLPADFWMNQSELWYEVNQIVEELESLRQTIEDLAPQIKAFQTLQAE